MKNNKTLALSILVIGLIFISLTDAAAQQLLLNEVEIDPPSTQSNGCQFAEIRGTPGATVAANTYFLSVNNDAGNFGFANQAVNIGGLVVGANGTITLYNSGAGPCPNRVFPASTTLLTYTSPLNIGAGSETYLLVRSTGTLFSGLDLDSDDDGIFNAALGITVLDGFALIVIPEDEYVYGAAAGVVNISNTISVDQPDAVTRFPGNSTPFAAAAFYFGEISGASDESTEYTAPLSPNFPVGGALTPGGANVPGGSVPVNTARADFDGDGRTDFSVFRPSEGNWYLRRSMAGQLTLRWGESGDTLIPGDYDGDGKTDTAVFRASSGAAADFYILNSNGFVINNFSFGEPGDEPVVGDYNADGRTDAAVYRPANNTWYIRLTDNSFRQVVFGAAGDLTVPAD